jgi:hypothetical protein
VESENVGLRHLAGKRTFKLQIGASDGPVMPDFVASR